MFLLKFVSSKIEARFTEKRSKKVALNVVNSSFVKILSVFVTFLLIPVSINYVTKDVFGVWLTISSILTWINLFDFGLTNGLQNRITEAYSLNNLKIIKVYLSTSYAILFSILLPLGSLFLIYSSYINWQYVLNTNVDKNVLDVVIKVAIVAFCLQLFLKPINALLMAFHRHYLASFITFLANLIALLLIVLFGKQFSNSLIFLTIVISFAPALVMFLFSIFLFKNQYSSMSPAFCWIRFEQRKKLFNIGMKFFIIQITGLVIFSSNNILIAHIEEAASVTTYNVVFRYFSMITLFQSLFLGPLWPGFTEAYVHKDYQWIKNVMNKVNLLSLGLCVVLLLMVIISNLIYSKWIGNNFAVPFSFNILMALSVAIGLFAVNYTVFINGTGKILFQTYISAFVCILHIPFAYILMHSFKLGLNGLVILNILWMVLSTVLWSLQYKKILSDVPSKIWNT